MPDTAHAPNHELRTRFDKCKGMNTQQIAEELADLDLDTITRELLLMCIERSDTSIFRSVPLTIRQTLYGDDDISDWILRYTDDGTATIEEATEDAELDAHVRWERWEDLVRLVNDNVSGMSLFYALRTIALGENDFRSNGRWWFMGINFTNDPDPLRPGKLIGYLRGKVWADDDELDAYVEEVTLDKLLEARARTLAYTMADLGAAEMLAGSYVRWEIDGYDTMAQVDFHDADQWSFRFLTHKEAEAVDPSTGVTTFFTSVKPFLYAAGGREELTGQLVSGTAKLVGPDDRLKTFSAATRKMYSPGAMN